MGLKEGNVVDAALDAVWTAALALEYEDPNEIVVQPSAEGWEEGEGPVWVASMTAGVDNLTEAEEDDSGYIFCKGKSPSAALAALALDLHLRLEARALHAKDTLAKFEAQQDWDEIRVVFRREAEK